jgi:UDP-N-acetylglucosamine 2-epimerase (non-hydrolysing)
MHVVGARPNFPKLAPVFRAALATGIDQLIVHTGQHYDAEMSQDFFRDLDIRPPDVNLAIGSASHAAQTGRIMERIEPVLLEHRPDWLLVYGDVNSTVAAALVAVKLGIRVAHVEAGLRSYDLTMPEEINRIVTDRLASLLLTPSRDAGDTLRAEGEPDDEIAFVGNVMIDTLFHSLPMARATGFRKRLCGDIAPLVVTLHRPSNVDDSCRLRVVMSALESLSKAHPVIFPAHPRTRDRLQRAEISIEGPRILEPISYFEMLDLVDGAHAVVTDSGGLQEETTALGVPCFTLRESTERPITIEEGTNQLVHDLSTLGDVVGAARRSQSPQRPEGWDGHAAERVIASLQQHFARAEVTRSGRSRMLEPLAET